MDRAKVADIIKKSPLASQVDFLLTQIEPCISIGTTPAKLSDLAIGASRFGGIPDLPKSFDWPNWTMAPKEVRNPFTGQNVTLGAKGKRWLSLMAQIELSDLPDSPVKTALPAEGRLYFFLDKEHANGDFKLGVGGWRVIYDASPVGELQRVTHPPANKGDESIPLLALNFTASLSADKFPPVKKKWTMEQHYAWDTILDQVERSTKSARLHRIGGGPRSVQDGGQRDFCNYIVEQMQPAQKSAMTQGSPWKKMRLDPGSWMLLLQIDHDEDAGLIWGDNGRAFYFIHMDDLAAKRFDRGMFSWESN